MHDLPGDPWQLEDSDDGAGHVGGFTQPTQRGALAQAVHPAWKSLRIDQHRRSSDTGPNSVHPDAITPPLHGGDLDQHVDSGLGHAVGAHISVGDGATYTGNGHDRTVHPGVDHGLRSGADGQPGAGEVDG